MVAAALFCSSPLMPYLNLDPDFFGHPKCVRLTGILGIGAEVYPLRLWCYAAKYHPEDGLLLRYQPQEVARIAGWLGTPEEFVSAMLTVGFFERHELGWRLHDWPDHQGHLLYLKKRAMLGALARWKSIKHRKLGAHTKALLKHRVSKTPPRRKGKVRKGKVIVLSLQEKEVVLGEKQETPIQTLVNRFLELHGTSRTTLTAQQVTLAYQRHGRSAKALIAEAGGLDHALAALEWGAAYFNSKQLTWTLDTIAKHLPTFARAGGDDAIRRQYGLTPGQVQHARELADWLTRVRAGNSGGVPVAPAPRVPHLPVGAGGRVALPAGSDGRPAA